jgi:phage terminase small subunit
VTDRQAHFCEQYLIDLNATQAARAAGFAKRSAKVRGHRSRRHTCAPAAGCDDGNR